jgi:hypothetical protein
VNHTVSTQPPALASQYSAPDRHLAGLEAVQQNSIKEGLQWGGDLPLQAERFFSPMCIWSRVKDTKVHSVLLILCDFVLVLVGKYHVRCI